MNIDVVDIFWLQFCIFQSVLHNQLCSQTFWVRSGKMVSISAHANASNAGKDLCATLLSVRKAFENEHASTFTDNEAIAVNVERAGSGGRIVVTLGESLHGAETSNSNFVHGFVGTACQHDVSTAKTDGVDGGNKHRGNLDEDVLVPEFAFDGGECPMVFVHGDDDVSARRGSRAMSTRWRSATTASRAGPRKARAATRG